MVYLIVDVWYPPGQESKAANKYLEVMKKYPADLSIGDATIPIAVNSTPEGIHSITVTNVKKGKLEQAMKDSLRNMLEFSGIEGIRYQIRTYLTGPEAFGLINLQMPE